MKNYKDKVVETAEFLRARIEKLPQIGLMTGTGLGESAASLDISASFEYKDIPHFPISTVESHLGRLLFGSMQGKQIIAMQGSRCWDYRPELTLTIRIHLFPQRLKKSLPWPSKLLQGWKWSSEMLWGRFNPLARSQTQKQSLAFRQ